LAGPFSSSTQNVWAGSSLIKEKQKKLKNPFKKIMIFLHVFPTNFA
jgi:hypothetical protein